MGDLNAAWVTFELNHRTLPTFSAGGMQLQLFNGDDVASHVDANENKLLKNAGESITWTQSMELVDGQLVFAVSDGQSTTWGPFANNGHLQRAVATTLTDLGDYDPNLSVQNSGVVLAANRVESLLMRKFRLILEDGQILEDDTVRIVAGDN
ncbi:MAG: hypothetical protein QGG36_31225 [Pirellulaceae bacterium]|nr:hypothetical protein [Pirellulaceae bacterium]